MKPDSTNLFAELVRRAKSEKWCMELFCTTCGAMRFRNEVTEIGLERVIDAMYSLNEEEINEILTAPGDPVGIVERDASFFHQARNMWKPEMPPVILRREAAIQAIRQAKSERRKHNLQSEAKMNEERQAKRTRETARIIECRKKAKQERESILEEFSVLNLQGKLQVIAKDTHHLPNYYPLQIECITLEDLDTVNSEVVAKLLTRLSKLNSSRWDSIRRRLNAVIKERLE